ncbi:hypothetical protein JTE90_023521 [Oedothorax gibbosus]|uniref:Uncharacterized protein n=1 Tax=Oedothorax gibbosus TaxID=931172 RepID=A0AAV6VSV7_9ARAC|nr:hypothetical protein JTE90_023521 [Oedothorax gibbosus]
MRQSYKRFHKELNFHLPESSRYYNTCKLFRGANIHLPAGPDIETFVNCLEEPTTIFLKLPHQDYRNQSRGANYHLPEAPDIKTIVTCLGEPSTLFLKLPISKTRLS